MLLSKSPSSQSWSSHFNGYSGSGSSKSKMSVFDSILHNQGNQACTHQLSLSPVGKITSYLVTFQLCCFGEEMMPAKSSSSLYLLECIQTFLFFYFVLLQLSTGTSLLETWASTKSLSLLQVTEFLFCRHSQTTGKGGTNHFITSYRFYKQY